MSYDIEKTAQSLKHKNELINRFPIREFKKTRWVNDPIPELKSALKEWNQDLTNYYVNQLKKHNINHIAHAYLPKKSVKTNALIHKDSEKIIKFDFTKFYDSVLYNYIKQDITALHAPKKLTHTLIKRLIIDPETNGLTQGLPVSGALAGLALIPFWVELQKTLKQKAPNIQFTQYSDDLTFSLINNHKSKYFNIKALTEIILTALKKSKRSNFKLNQDKTIIQVKQFRRVTGIRINNENNLCCSTKDFRKLRTITHVLSKNLNTMDVLNDFGYKSKEAFVGKISYMRTIDDEGKIERFIQKNKDIFLEHNLFKTWIINKKSNTKVAIYS